MREVKQVSRHLYTECGTLEEEEGEAIPPSLIRGSKPSAGGGIDINGGIPYEG